MAIFQPFDLSLAGVRRDAVYDALALHTRDYNARTLSPPHPYRDSVAYADWRPYKLAVADGLLPDSPIGWAAWAETATRYPDDPIIERYEGRALDEEVTDGGIRMLVGDAVRIQDVYAADGQAAADALFQELAGVQHSARAGGYFYGTPPKHSAEEQTLIDRKAIACGIDPEEISRVVLSLEYDEAIALLMAPHCGVFATQLAHVAAGEPMTSGPDLQAEVFGTGAGGTIIDPTYTGPIEVLHDGVVIDAETGDIIGEPPEPGSLPLLGAGGVSPAMLAGLGAAALLFLLARR